MFLNSTSNYPTGFDISDSSLKLVQLDKSGDKIKVQAMGKMELEEGLFNKGEIIKKDMIVMAIKKFFNNPQYGKVSSDEVVACLPETKTFLKLIEVEKSPNDFNNVISAEIEKHVPMAIDEIYYDWQVVRNLRDRQFVLIGASPRKIVDSYTSLLEEAGLSVVGLEIESIAICRSLLPEESGAYKGPCDKNYAIIDFGAARTSLTLYSKNTILFTISIPISGNNITEKIAKILDIDYSQAEKAKMICGLDENKAQGVVKNILANVIEELNYKINETLEFYKKHFSDRGPVSQIILCGGGANIKNLEKIISESTKINTILGDSLFNITKNKESIAKILKEVKYGVTNRKDVLSKNNEIFNNEPDSSFATAIGLALRDLFLN